MMIALPLLALLQATPATPAPVIAPDVQARLAQCITASEADPAAAIELANAWIAEGGGRAARHCLGIAFFDAGQYRAAETVLADAGMGADGQRDPAAAHLWALAGSAALAQREASTARDYLDFAITQGRLSGLALATTHADLAKARVALGEMAGARQSVDEAIRLAPQEGPFWLLSATLARRMADGPRAQADVQQAAALSPRDPAVALEAGNIAYLADNFEAARRSWESAIAIAPQSAVAASARRRIADMQAEEDQSTVSPAATRLPEPPR
jgi:tetratricopeptide (TPR) repeat protein